MAIHEPKGRGEAHDYYSPELKLKAARYAYCNPQKGQEAIARMFCVQHPCLISKWKTKFEKYLVRRAIEKALAKGVL